jgi:hypothetical protein
MGGSLLKFFDGFQEQVLPEQQLCFSFTLPHQS